ncbi:transcriptional regulator, MarR family [Roseibium hamelinense]|uniref:Transcriptional regulator, MarR family n=1 Tax=Roseibium hamelinense TaxID=150831 RepID=A0A562SKH2_9HYPH|nr:MarR family transcriptional regulator [Roseibium hamelinense]MTI43309.1 MarR family transcriptional regulator [Roseibium hamelinense]TWI81761.1 transcriptional regulator, MarR family [Roseibium hamelinense]
MSITAPNSGATLMIVDIARLLRKRFETALAHVDTGLTVAEARALAFVWRNPGLRQAAIAERMSVEPMTLVGYLDALEREGLVERKVDPSDRRAKLVTLTEAADPVLERIETAIMDVRKDALEGLTENQRDALEAALKLMRSNLCTKDQATPEAAQ